MKLAHVNKLYDKLTPKEQANLSFEAILRRDDAELQAIEAHVPLQTYQHHHYDYRSRSCGLFMMAMFYGTTYWKTRTLIIANHESRENLESLAAIDIAMKAVCTQLNVDFDAIRTMAQCEHEPLMTDLAKPELIAEFTEMFMGMVK
ncbi:MAG: hypothetical protein ACXWTS_06620 [Methylococcaceae bacterium]